MGIGQFNSSYGDSVTVASIVVYRSGSIIDQVNFNRGEIVIGRDPTSRIHLDDDFVSWAHATINVVDGGFDLYDQGSTNGTLVNGTRIQNCTLKFGDTIQIEDYQLKFNDTIENVSDYRGSERTLMNHRVIDSEVHAGDQFASAAHNKRWLALWLPILIWLGNYHRRDLTRDLQAGITIGALLVPQGMAYALLAGLPPIYGLYASTLPLVLYAISGTSRQLSVAPVALDSMLIASGIGVIAASGSDQYLHLVIVLALMVGTIQLALGLFRMGFVVNFLSQPVLTGFTSAAAIIITISQIQHLFGFNIESSKGFFNSLTSLLTSLHNIHYMTAVVGIVSIIFLVLIKKMHTPLPGPILLLAVMTPVSWLLNFDAQGVSLVGEVPQGLPGLHFIIPDRQEIIDLTPLALTIACIGLMEAISVGKVYASRYGHRIDANAEFRAIGLSNIAAHIVSSFPVTGGFARTAVNANSGAKTQLASIISAITIILVLLLLTPLFYHLPIAVLAAIIMHSVIGLIDIAEWRYLYKVKKIEGIVLLVTIIGTLTLGISSGLLVGITCSILLFIAAQTRPNTSQLGRLPGTQIYRSIGRHRDAQITPGIIILRVDASFYFANADFLIERVARIIDQPNPPETIVLDGSGINDLDSTGDRALRQIHRELNRKGIGLAVAGIKGPVRDMIKRSGLYSEIGAEHFFYTTAAAVDRFKRAH